MSVQTSNVVNGAIAVEKSSNRKIGEASATYVSQASCPTSCPFRGSGCYAESGFVGITTKRLNKSTETDAVTLARQEADAILSLSGKRDLRLHVVGDSTTEEGTRILADAASSYTARYGKTVWSYTHAQDIPRGAWGEVSILRSVETVKAAKQASDAGYAAAMVVESFEDTKAYPIGEGLTGIPCPVQTGKADSCVKCRLCLNADKLHAKNRVVLFEAHSDRASKVKQALKVINA